VNAAILIGVIATWALAALSGTIHWEPQPYSVREIMATAGKLDVRGALQIGLFEIIFVFLFVDLSIIWEPCVPWVRKRVCLPERATFPG
jgi:AGZA family xanthine/uracil permease-like MFS transporter